MNYRLGLYEKSMRESLSIFDKLNFAKESGFDFLEISIDETDAKLKRLDWDKDYKAELSAFMHQNNFYIESMCLSAHRKYPLGSENTEIQKRSVEIAEKAIIFARDLGIRIIQLAGYDVYYEKSSQKTMENFEKNLKKCVDFASKYGVILAFETMETPFMNTIEKAMEYINIINSPYLQVYPDTGNITNSGVSVADNIKKGTGYIVAAHLKETKANIFRDVKFGEGHVDFAKAIKAYKEAGCTKFLAEMWDNKQDNWDEEIFKANKFLRGYLDEVFTRS